MNLLYFSDHISKVEKKVKFLLIICWRFFIVLLRWEKDIKVLYLKYAIKYQFDNSYLIIRYKFRNAIWYSFKSITKTTEDKIIILNISNVPKTSIELTVNGFFRSKKFYISVTPESILRNSSFKTVLKRVNKIEKYATTIMLKDIKPTPRPNKIKIAVPEVQIKQSLYNQTDLL